MKKLSTITSAIALFAAFAISSGAEDKTTLKRVYKAHTATTYKITVKLPVSDESGGQGITFNIDMKESVQDVNKTGIATVLVNLLNPHIFMGETEYPAEQAGLSKLPTFTKTIDADGEFLKVAVKESTPNVQQFQQMSEANRFHYPKTAVAKGDAWSFETKEVTATKQPSSTSKYIVEGTEKVNGIDTLKVKVNTKITSGASSGTVLDGSAWIDPTNGELAKANYIISGSKQAQGNINFSLERTASKASASTLTPANAAGAMIDPSDTQPEGINKVALPTGRPMVIDKDSPPIKEPKN